MSRPIETGKREVKIYDRINNKWGNTTLLTEVKLDDIYKIVNEEDFENKLYIAQSNLFENTNGIYCINSTEITEKFLDNVNNIGVIVNPLFNEQSQRIMQDLCIRGYTVIPIFLVNRNKITVDEYIRLFKRHEERLKLISELRITPMPVECLNEISGLLVKARELGIIIKSYNDIHNIRYVEIGE